MIDIIYLIITYESQIRECTTHRSKYIEDILKQHNVVDKVTINENSETSEIKDSVNDIKYYTYDAIKTLNRKAINANNFHLVRAICEARCSFQIVNFDTDLIPLRYTIDDES